MAKNIKVVDGGQTDLFEGTSHAKKSDISYTNEQASFIEHDGKESIILSACAGSGKTFSSVQKLKEIVKKGVDPNRIIFFSFTTAATDELKTRVRKSGINAREKVSGKDQDGVTITTIHAFANSLLARMGKFKKISMFSEFLKWFKKEYRPSPHASREKKESYDKLISEMYENSEQLSSAIGSFKLQVADNVKAPLPQFLNEYNKFLKETRSRDFSDILIEVRDLLRENKWSKRFKSDYDYVFIDEYQDTSTIQLQILLSLNAKSYYLMGDKNQSIFGYSGSNCDKLEKMISNRREVVEMNLTVNFRSDLAIVDYSNNYSVLKAVANSKEEGHVNTKIMTNIDELIELFKQKGEVVALVRTNAVIKQLEKEFLKRKIPMKYHNFITEDDVSKFKKNDVSPFLRGKLNNFKGHFENDAQLINFIETFKKSPKQIISIHKSKGREFDECVIINSISPEVLMERGIYDKIGKKRLKRISFTDSDEDL